MELGRLGVWSRELRNGDAAEAANAAAELESLGFGAIWMPGGPSGEDFFGVARRLLDATRSIVVASRILSVWTNSPEDVARARTQLEAAHAGRFLLGLGVSHASIVERVTGRRYERPLTVMERYLDELDGTSAPVPDAGLALAALGPKMLALARDRSACAHPYFVTPEHTRLARFVLGADCLLAPEQAVVLERDPERARAIGRRHLEYYLAAPNYVANLRRIGIAEPDLEGDGSDALVDALVAWGDVEAIGRRIAEHRAAGADHVCLQVLTGTPGRIPLEEWRALAPLTRA